MQCLESASDSGLNNTTDQKAFFFTTGHDQTFLFSSYDNGKAARELFKEHETVTELFFEG